MDWYTRHTHEGEQVPAWPSPISWPWSPLARRDYVCEYNSRALEARSKLSWAASAASDECDPYWGTLVIQSPSERLQGGQMSWEDRVRLGRLLGFVAPAPPDGYWIEFHQWFEYVMRAKGLYSTH